jgi:hypothetical protein
VNMLFVVLLMLDCLVCVYGVRLEDHSTYLTCIANPAGCTELGSSGLTGTMPTELGLMTSMELLYASTTLRPCVSLNDCGY